MSDTPEYVPPKVWTWNKESGGRFAAINRPIAGATHEKDLPVGKHPMQLYSLGTPNGVKVTVMLEELLALGLNCGFRHGFRHGRLLQRGKRWWRAGMAGSGFTATGSEFTA